MDEGIKKTVTAIPLLSVKAGPRDPNWGDRLKEELSALIASVNKNKAEDNDWFKIAPQDKTGTQWKGTCWFVHEHVKYEFNLQFEVPVTYPETAPEIEIPSLDGKTAKIYRFECMVLM
jgi:ufm1-conjugating enzyme 1